MSEYWHDVLELSIGMTALLTVILYLAAVIALASQVHWLFGNLLLGLPFIMAAFVKLARWVNI